MVVILGGDGLPLELLEEIRQTSPAAVCGKMLQVMSESLQFLLGDLAFCPGTDDPQVVVTLGLERCEGPAHFLPLVLEPLDPLLELRLLRLDILSLEQLLKQLLDLLDVVLQLLELLGWCAHGAVLSGNSGCVSTFPTSPLYHRLDASPDNPVHRSHRIRVIAGIGAAPELGVEAAVGVMTPGAARRVVAAPAGGVEFRPASAGPVSLSAVRVSGELAA